MRAGGVVVLMSLLAFGCGGGGTDTAGVTRGTQCEQLMEAYCSRASEVCQQFPAAQVSDCVQSGKTSCCAGNCGGVAFSSQQDIATCIADIGAADCASLDTAHGGMLPGTCQRVVTSATPR